MRKRLITLSSTLACLFILSACGGPAVNLPNLPGGEVSHPTNFDPTLIARYHKVNERDNGEGGIDLEASYGGLTYQPRQSEFAGYVGWDVLEVPKSDSQRGEWLYLTLNRDARLAVVWEGSAGWLVGWRKAGSIGEDNVYIKDVSKGEVALGSPGEGNGSYTLLLAEKGGKASSQPKLPVGISEADRPVPNAECPEWVDNLYLTEGNDGNMYETWHPQIDGVYWCYFTHEHGSDPALIGYNPVFRYVADKNDFQKEQHEGFKGYAVRDEENNVGWYVNIHATTSAISRVCARLHTVVVAATDLKTGELLAELSYKGDFGSLKTTASINGEKAVLQPTFKANCPDQSAIASETGFVKQVRVHNVDGVSQGGYEHWRGGLNKTLGLDFRGNGIDLDIRDPVTACDGLKCTQAINTGSKGTRRNIRYNNMSIRYAPVEILDSADGSKDGVFYTNVYGTELRNAGDIDAVKQFVKPGLDIEISGSFKSEDAWRVLYSKEGHVANLELEGSLRDN